MWAKEALAAISDLLLFLPVVIGLLGASSPDGAGDRLVRARSYAVEAARATVGAGSLMRRDRMALTGNAHDVTSSR